MPFGTSLVSRALLLFLCVFSAAVVPAGSVSVWHPLGFSRLGPNKERPTVLESANYALQNNLTQGRFDSLVIKNGAQPEKNLFAQGPLGGMTISLTDASGKVYSSIFYDGSVEQGRHGGTPYYETSMRLHLTGDLFHESEIMKIRFADSEGKRYPAEAQIHMFQWDDRIYFKVVLNAQDNLKLKKAELIATFDEMAFDSFRTADAPDAPIPPTGNLVAATPVASGVIFGGSSSSAAGSLAWIIGDPAGTQSFEVSRGTYGLQTTPALIVRQSLCDEAVAKTDTELTSGSHISNSFQLFFSGESSTEPGYSNLQAELNPLTLKILGSSSGAAVVGEYNKLNGTYNINMPTEHANTAGYRFSNTFQNYYETAMIEIPADPLARTNRICINQPTGLWGAGVQTDQFGYPRGGRIMSSRGLKAFQVVKTEANQGDIFQHKGVYKRYGESPAYLMSHEDLGAGYDPHGQMWLNAVNGINGGFSYSLVQRVYSSVCDVSAIDGNPKFGNPADQFPENTGGHEFLKYRTSSPNQNAAAPTATPAPDAALAADSEFHQIEFAVNTDWHEIEFRALDYARLSPLLVDGNWRGFSDDHKIETSIHLINVPFTDVCRMFVRMRYDVKKPVNFDSPGALKRNFRLFSMGDENYGQSDYARFAYTDIQGKLQDGDWAESVGIPLGGSHPFATVYPNFTSNRGMLVRSYKARINGQENNTPAVTLSLIDKKRAGFWLVPHSDETQLIPGDFFEIEMEIAFYGTEKSNFLAMQKEAQAWGRDGLQFEMTRGSVTSTMPPRITAENGRTAFKMKGGRNYVPLEIGGFNATTGPNYKLPNLEEKIAGVWVPFNPEVTGKDGWDVNRDETTGDIAFLYNIWTDGSEREFRFSLSAERLDFEEAAFPAAGAGKPETQPAVHGGAFVVAEAVGSISTFAPNLEADGPRLVTPMLFARSAAGSAMRLAVNGVNQPDFTLPAAEGFQVHELPEVTLNPGQNVLTVTLISGAAELDYLQLAYERPAATKALDAVVVDHAFPPIVNFGEKLTAALRVKNTGTEGWTGPDDALQGLFDDAPTYPLPAGKTVAPGASYSFQIPLEGKHVYTPSQYLAQVTSWSMVRHSEDQAGANRTHYFGQFFKREIQFADLYSYAPKEFSSPSFEQRLGTPPFAWNLAGTAELTSDTAHTGSLCVRLREPGETSLSQSIGLHPNSKYRLAFWVKSGEKAVNTTSRVLIFSPQTGTYLVGDSVERKGVFDWTRQEITFDTGTVQMAMFLISLTGGSPAEPYGELYVDDIELTRLDPPAQ